MQRRSLDEILGQMTPELRDQVRDFAEYLLESKGRGEKRSERHCDTERLLRFTSIPARISFSLFLALGLAGHASTALRFTIPSLSLPWWISAGVVIFWPAFLAEFPRLRKIWYGRGMVAKHRRKLLWTLAIISVPVFIECLHEFVYWVLPSLVWDWSLPQWMSLGPMTAINLLVVFIGIQSLRCLWSWSPMEEGHGKVTLIGG